jgi:UDP-N-acetylmuramate dehydrogenase
MAIQIQDDISLKPFNSFGIAAKARFFSRFTSPEELEELLLLGKKVGPRPALILGGGSNILLTGNFDGLVLQNAVKGIELIREDSHYVYVRAAAGENWHAFVRHCIRRDWQGIENLSLIPGLVGAGPIQNIGAYGVELHEVFEELEAYHRRDQKVYTLSTNDCGFGYRDSVFKQQRRDEFVILRITLRLNKIPRFRTEYGAIREELERMGVSDLSAQAISEAVIRIRTAKLPDPAQIGNAGSFFKNPTIAKSKFRELQGKFPEIVGFDNPDGQVKLAAAWMIEQCGWKGYRSGDAGCHERQPLVLVNYGNASGAQILGLSREIGRSVEQRFGIRLEPEVNII